MMEDWCKLQMVCLCECICAVVRAMYNCEFGEIVVRISFMVFLQLGEIYSFIFGV